MSGQIGLCQKYKVEKADGSPIDPDAQYFVLCVDTDPHARAALRAYAGSVHHDDFALARDLVNWLRELEGNEQLDGLTDAERDVLNYLATAWHAYLELPEQHPSDRQEFLAALHELQRLLAIRAVRRAYPKYWLCRPETTE